MDEARGLTVICSQYQYNSPDPTTPNVISSKFALFHTERTSGPAGYTASCQLPIPHAVNRVRIRRGGWAHVAPSASACRSASTTPLRKMHRRSLFPCQPLPIMTGPACQRAAMLLTVPYSGRVSLNAAVKPKRHFPRVRTPIFILEARGW